MYLTKNKQRKHILDLISIASIAISSFVHNPSLSLQDLILKIQQTAIIRSWGVWEVRPTASFRNSLASFYPAHHADAKKCSSNSSVSSSTQRVGSSPLGFQMFQIFQFSECSRLSRFSKSSRLSRFSKFARFPDFPDFTDCPDFSNILDYLYFPNLLDSPDFQDFLYFPEFRFFQNLRTFQIFKFYRFLILSRFSGFSRFSKCF